jgi:hypothetical protein
MRKVLEHQEIYIVHKRYHCSLLPQNARIRAATILSASSQRATSEGAPILAALRHEWRCRGHQEGLGILSRTSGVCPAMIDE